MCIESSQPTPITEGIPRIALEMARMRVKFSLPYISPRLGSCGRKRWWRLSGIQTHPSSEHLGSLALCFRTSASSAAAPTDMLASGRMETDNGDVTVTSKAACLPLSHFQSKFLWSGVFGQSQLLNITISLLGMKREKDIVSSAVIKQASVHCSGYSPL
eukprot:Em0006g457a